MLLCHYLYSNTYFDGKIKLEDYLDFSCSDPFAEEMMMDFISNFFQSMILCYFQLASFLKNIDKKV